VCVPIDRMFPVDVSGNIRVRALCARSTGLCHFGRPGVRMSALASSLSRESEVAIGRSFLHHFNQLCLLKRNRVRIGMLHLRGCAKHQQEKCNFMKTQDGLHHVSSAEL